MRVSHASSSVCRKEGGGVDREKGAESRESAAGGRSQCFFFLFLFLAVCFGLASPFASSCDCYPKFRAK